MPTTKTIDGKTYEQLNSWERDALDRRDPETFAQMREQSLRAERVYVEALKAAYHAGAIDGAGVDGLRERLDSGELTYAQATSIVRELPRPTGAA